MKMSMTWATGYFTTQTATVYSAEYTPLQSIESANSDGGMDHKNAADFLLGSATIVENGSPLKHGSCWGFHRLCLRSRK